ncbi:YadA C-terminal domain-containing protein [uncultured Megasphaera sp.]|uniref:YadA C-terminal domain-containing protein n=2 Tax=uncultured Megasphaera sp. TaxID=165188 RepID=UPI0025EFA5E2|nr:YadA C-terminal domain-containing protein [uncultured Megasphaera sp.]
MNLSGKKLTTAILAGLMGATMFGGSVFAEVTDQEFNEVRQGVNSNTQRISQLESAQSAAKDYSKDIAANTTAIANEATARTDADTKLDTRITNVKEYLENQTAANYVSKTDAAVQDGAVVKAGNTIGENVTNLDGALAKETAARIGADAAQDKVIKQVNDNLVSSVNTINKNVADGFNALNATDQTLQKNIDANAGNIVQNKQDIADIQKTLSSAGAIASADATNAANKAANDATAAATNANNVANGLKDRVDLISNNQNVTSESDLIKKDQSIGQNLTNVDTALHKEIADRIGADAAQDKVIKQVNDNLVSSVNTINKNVANGFNALSAVDLQEAQTRAAADKTLQDNIDAEATARDQAVAQERAERKGADAAQDKVIKQVNDNLVSSVNTINKNVADGFNALSAVDLQEAQTRAAADQTLQNQIANNAQAIGTTKDGNYVKSNNSVGQNLNVLDAQVGQNSANINQLFSDYSSMKTDINKVGARSAALAGLHPLDFDPANKLNFAVASGSFKGENSVALGAFYRPNENVMFSAASTMGDSDNAYTFGLSFKIGPSSAKTKTTSPDAEELYKVVGQLQDQLAAQQKEIEQLKAEKAAK